MMHSFKASSAGAWMEIDITLPQLRTLLILAEEGPLVIGQIAQRLGIGLSTGGHLVCRLLLATTAERRAGAAGRCCTYSQFDPTYRNLHTRPASGRDLELASRQLPEDHDAD